MKLLRLKDGSAWPWPRRMKLQERAINNVKAILAEQTRRYEAKWLDGDL